ncbi:MAG: histidinol dehydrogenase [Pseudomonadota bacterium]
MKKLVWNNLDSAQKASALMRPKLGYSEAIPEIVKDILTDVRKNGDTVVKNYTQKFDSVSLENFEVSQNDKRELDSSICQAIETAYNNIKNFHAKQGYQKFTIETMDGISCSREVRTIERVGLYIPGGTAPLVSSTLMLGIPAQMAGCKSIIMCTPCDKNGEINPYIIFAARLCGVQRIFSIGGAQAIAAMAYGTESVPKVDKICGPGNAYVTEAKQQIARDPFGASIDMPAGPSEVCVIEDKTTNPSFAAADLLSQAEHDVMSQVLLISTDEEILNATLQEVDRQLANLPRRDIAAQAIKNSVAVISASMDEAIEISNDYAPEHLILCFDAAQDYVTAVQNAGSVFVGPWTPESAGDYASGTNHVLPTYGYARTYSGLNVEAFQKTITVQNISQQGLQNIGDCVETLANLEGLDAHARAISIRRKAA